VFNFSLKRNTYYFSWFRSTSLFRLKHCQKMDAKGGKSQITMDLKWQCGNFLINLHGYNFQLAKYITTVIADAAQKWRRRRAEPSDPAAVAPLFSWLWQRDRLMALILDRVSGAFLCRNGHVLTYLPGFQSASGGPWSLTNIKADTCFDE